MKVCSIEITIVVVCLSLVTCWSSSSDLAHGRVVTKTTVPSAARESCREHLPHLCSVGLVEQLRLSSENDI